VIRGSRVSLAGFVDKARGKGQRAALPAMAQTRLQSFRTAQRQTLWAAVFAIGCAIVGGAFAFGFSGALQSRLANPEAAPLVRLRAAHAISVELGYSAFLKDYRAYLVTGESTLQQNLRRRFDAAKAAQVTFARAAESGDDRAVAGDLLTLIAPFSAAAGLEPRPEAAQTGAPSEAALERAYDTLARQTNAAEDAARRSEMAALERALAAAQSVSVSVLIAVSCALFFFAWLIRKRLTLPLQTLRISAERIANGGIAAHLWGLEREDEIGALARSVERLRLKETAAPEAKPGFDPASSQAFLRLIDHMTRSAAQLDARLATLSGEAAHTRDQMQAASLEAARAAKTAAQSAALAQEAVSRKLAKLQSAEANPNPAASGEAERALRDATARLAEAASRVERGGHLPQWTALPNAAKPQGKTKPSERVTLDGLLAELEALEAATRTRERFDGGDGGKLSAELADAIGRLNDVAAQVTAARTPASQRAQGVNAELMQAIGSLNDVAAHVAAATEARG
jgi:HAMP domain-containing protein